jgi:hypothetical protein
VNSIIPYLVVSQVIVGVASRILIVIVCAAVAIALATDF